MAEQELQIYDTGVEDKKNGGTFKNIYLKTKTKVDPSSGDVDVKKGLADGNHVIVQKVFDKGFKIEKPNYTIFSCKVRYKDEEVTFILNEKEHERYVNTGGMDDKVKITATAFESNFGGSTRKFMKLDFELVE